MNIYTSAKAQKRLDVWNTEIRLKAVSSARDAKLKELLKLLKKEEIKNNTGEAFQ